MANMQPMTYNIQNYINFANMQPSSVKGRNNSAVAKEKRLLYNLIYSRFDFKIPKEWSLNWFRFWLFHYGSIAVIYTKEYGWIVYPYSVTGLDLYYQPNEIMVIINGLNENKYGKIGVNAEIVKCFDDFFGFESIVDEYAEKLANIDKSININLMNSNMSLLFEVESKKQSDEIKTAYGKVTTGEPMVVVNKDVLNGKQATTLMPSPKSNFIALDLLNARRTILNQFLTHIGIQNANYDKKERLNSQEVEQNTEETRAIIDVVFDNIKQSFGYIREMSGLDIDVTLNRRVEDVNSIRNVDVSADVV